ncbi:MAG: hypothetical protein N2491_07700 [Negativicutes bacterium]|nr:hypothetical protein [Negativicutes bacterium]
MDSEKMLILINWGVLIVVLLPALYYIYIAVANNIQILNAM